MTKAIERRIKKMSLKSLKKEEKTLERYIAVTQSNIRSMWDAGDLANEADSLRMDAETLEFVQECIEEKEARKRPCRR